MIIRWAYSKSK